MQRFALSLAPKSNVDTNLGTNSPQSTHTSGFA